MTSPAAGATPLDRYSSVAKAIYGGGCLNTDYEGFLNIIDQG